MYTNTTLEGRKEIFLEKLYNRFNGDYTLIGEYVSWDVKTNFRHKCGELSNRTPNGMLFNNFKCTCESKNKKDKSYYKIGESYIMNDGTTIRIIGYDGRKRIIDIDEGDTIPVSTKRIEKGEITNFKNDKSYFGVATLGGYGLTNHILYWRWFNMIGRCYNEEHCGYNSYGKRGVVVEEYLLNFKNYMSFVSNLENYNELIHNPKKWDIDKDKYSDGLANKIYSRDTICIMPKEMNLEIENQPKRISVEQIDNIGNIINVFESITLAEISTGIPRGNIARAVRNGGNAGGFKWRKIDA